MYLDISKCLSEFQIIRILMALLNLILSTYSGFLNCWFQQIFIVKNHWKFFALFKVGRAILTKYPSISGVLDVLSWEFCDRNLSVLNKILLNTLVSVINDNFPFVSKTAGHAFTDALGQNSMLVIFFNKWIILSTKGKDI